MQNPPQPTSILQGCLFIIAGCIFVAFGLLMFGTEVQGAQEAGVRLEVTGATLLFAVFGLIPMIIGARAIRQARRLRAVATRCPDQPWMLHAHWASGRIRSANRHQTLFIAGIAVFWNGVACFALFHLFRDGAGADKKAVLLILLFVALGLAVGAVALYKLLRWRKYGSPLLEMAQVPGVVGGSLGGVVRTRMKHLPPEGFNLRLRSIHRTVTSHNNKHRVHTETLWEREQRRLQPQLNRSGASAIPVLFTIPYACRPTGAIAPNQDCYWELVVTATVPGIDYKEVFHVPVYRTKDSSATVGSGLDDLPEDEKSAIGLDIHSVQGLNLRQTPGGGERMDFRLHPGGKGAFAAFTLVGVGMLGATYLLWNTDIPRFFLWIFIIIAAFMLQMSLPVLLSAISIVLHRERIEIVRCVLGIPRAPRVIAREQIERMDTFESIKLNNESFYGLVIHTTQGKSIRVPLRIRGQTQAEIVCNYIRNN